jgi:HK97 gp10 family phage protein
MPVGAVDISLLGDRKLERMLKRLQPNVQKKVVRKATREGAKTIAAEAKRNAPVQFGGAMRNKQTGRFETSQYQPGGQVGKPGELRRGIKVRAIPGLGNIGHYARTGTREEMGISESSKWYYPAHVEFGHTSRGTTVPANPFLRNAADSKASSVLGRMHRRIWQGVLREAKRK